MARRRGGDKLFKKEKEKRDFARKKADKLIEEKKVTPLKKYNTNGLSYKDYEYKWIVIDRDSEYRGGGHTKEDFKNTLNNAKNKRKDLHIDVAYSNDSFELWYLLQSKRVRAL